MGGIEAKINKLVAGNDNNITFEKAVYQLMNAEFSKILSRVFEDIDHRLVSKMQAAGYTVARKDKRSVQFLFGDVTFERRLWQKGKRYCYPLDELLGIAPHLRYSPLVQAKIANLTTKIEFRKVAEAVNSLTALNVSPSGVHAITQRIAEKTTAYQEDEKEIMCPQKKQIPVLYLEGDALLIKSQTKGRINIHRFQVHEGVKKNGNRSQCLNVHQFSGESRKRCFNDMLNYLQKHYDLSDTLIMSNSDGGSGYEPTVFYELALGCKQHEHFLDRYHLNRKIKERMYFCRELIEPMSKALKEYAKAKVTSVLDTMESIAVIQEDSQKAEQYTRLLRNYLERNWPYIKPFNKRQINVAKLGLGVCESKHRPYSYRMKHQGRSWCKKGAQNMIKLITQKQNGEYWKAIEADWDQRLSVDKEKTLDTQGLFSNDHVGHEGVRHGAIVNNGSKTALGALSKKYSS